MIKKGIIIIGKNSFIGSHIYRSLKIKRKKILSYEKFIKLNNKIISNYDFICNCAVKKKYKEFGYVKKNDLDLKISKKIKNLDIKYIFLSSRKVYKAKYNSNEKDKTRPSDQYSRNKLITENILMKILQEKLLILRISNVIGLKKNKNYRKINNTFFDNFLKYRINKKKVMYDNFFKDFISIDQFIKMFSLCLKHNLKGIYNLSIGKKIYLSELINWLNFHSKKNNIFVSKKRNFSKIKKLSFTLNNNKLTKKIKFKPSKNNLKIYCIKLSKKKI